MLKRFLCSAAIATLLCGSVSIPTEAEEVYVRNRLFKDAYMLGDTTYVPVDSFLRAVDMAWTVENGILVLGTGDSPEWSPQRDTFIASRNGNELVVNGILRGARIYVPAKELAEFVGYQVKYNADTGIVDIIQSRLTSSMDEKAAQEIAATNKAQKEARDAAWQERVAKAKAAREAKAAEEAAATEEADAEAGEDGETVLAAKGDPDVDPSDTKEQAIDGKDDRANASYEDESPKDAPDPTEEGPPPEAELIVLSTNAEPNNYTGEVKFRAVLQNQGYAKATDVKARFTVIGPDGKEWVAKTVYHAPMAPDERWEINETYKHRLGAAIPRGNYNVQVNPTFSSAPAK